MTHIQEIEEMEHGRDVPYWVAGVPCATYEEACYVAGCDTPADLAEEWEWRERLEHDRELDDLEINGPRFLVVDANDDIPF